MKLEGTKFCTMIYGCSLCTVATCTCNIRCKTSLYHLPCEP